MKELDFIPQSYHRDAIRRRRWHRGVGISLIVLCVVATFVSGRILRTLSAPREVEAKQAVPPTVTPAAETNRPTVAPDETDESVRGAAATLTLQGIKTGSRPMATINGRNVGAGETVEGFVLERIEATQVTVRRGTVRVTLKLDAGTDH